MLHGVPMLAPTEVPTPRLKNTREPSTSKLIGTRIKQIRTALKLTQALFSTSLRISPSHLSEAENGKTPQSGVLMVAICLQYNVNMEFLEHGQGEMFKEVNPSEGLASLEGVIPYYEDFQLRQAIVTPDTTLVRIPGATPGQFIVRAGNVVGLAAAGDLLLLAPLDKSELAGLTLFAVSHSGAQLVTKVLEMGKDFFLYPSPPSADPVKFKSADYSSVFKVVCSYRCVLS